MKSLLALEKPRERRKQQLFVIEGKKEIGLALQAGYTIGNLFYMLASQLGRLDVAAVICSMYPAGTILLAGIILREHPTRRQVAGMGLALAACVKGYKCIFTTTDKQSKEKMDILKAVGAEVIVCPTNVEPEDPRSYYSVASRLRCERLWRTSQSGPESRRRSP